MPTSPASEAISAKLPVRVLLPWAIKKQKPHSRPDERGGDEKQECDRQMSGLGWPLSVAFWFGLIGAGCGQGTYIINGRKVRKR